MSAIQTRLDLHRLDKEFRIQEKRSQPSRSWVIGMINQLYVCSLGSGNLAGITDVYAAAKTLWAQQNGWSSLAIGSTGGNCLAPTICGAAANPSYFGSVANLITGDLMGIIVGTNNTAVTPTDSKLNTRCNQGQGAGQLEYGGTEVLPPTFADPNGTLVIRRYITNVSGGDIAIAEVGIYASCNVTDANAHSEFCIARDIVGPAVTVHTTEILVVTYTMQITV
jgi:hypothetical protein